MMAITIEWRDAGDGTVRYWANGHCVGSDDEGFDAVLTMIRAHAKAVVTFKGIEPGLGGQSLGDTAPFAARFPELVEALRGRNLNWDLQ